MLSCLFYLLNVEVHAGRVLIWCLGIQGRASSPVSEYKELNCQSQTQTGVWKLGFWQVLGAEFPDPHPWLPYPQAIHLDMKLGEHTNDYAEFAAKDKLTQLRLRVQQLVEQVEQIQKEQEYQRVRGWAGPVGQGMCNLGGGGSVLARRFLHSPLPQWREERFRQTSESTNRRVLWWSILQTLILVATGIWQMQHLKSFFKAKKLV